MRGFGPEGPCEGGRGRKEKRRFTTEWKQPSGQDKEQIAQLTVTVCTETDAELEAEGLDPAPHFRQARKTNNRQYIRAWVLGCHFPWLNPR
jgi:hypothetical protein